MSNNTQILGQHAEQQACQFLTNQGLKLVAKNFRTRCGEIDLIMRDEQKLVFIEVRYRKQGGYGSSADSISTLKQKRLIKSAAYYLQKHRLSHKIASRFDVIAIDKTKEKNSITWIKDAFQVE